MDIFIEPTVSLFTNIVNDKKKTYKVTEWFVKKEYSNPENRNQREHETYHTIKLKQTWSYEQFGF